MTYTITIPTPLQPPVDPWSLDPVGAAFAAGLPTSVTTAIVGLALSDACGLPPPPIHPGGVVLIIGFLGACQAVASVPVNLDSPPVKKLILSSFKFSALATLAAEIFFHAQGILSRDQ
jgi:hypothetical protein